jgi:outer membrane protein OmpA-like peptidoglycan-associated protein
MDKINLKRIGLLLVVLMFGSCAGGVVAPPGLSSKLIDIQVSDTDNATIITIKTNNLPQYAAFKVKSPPTITLDLASTDASGVSSSKSIGNGFVKDILVKQLGESTGYSTRITITLDMPLPYNVTTDGNNIVLNISKTAEQPAAEPSLQGLPLTGTTPMQTGLEMSPSAAPEALAPMGMEESPTTSLEAAPLAGIGTSPSAAPEALAPMGMEESPTTSLEAAPLAGIGTSPSAAPEELAPEGMEESPTTAPENTQANVINVTPPASAPEAPSVSNAPLTNAPEQPEVAATTVAPTPVVPAPVEKKHKAEEKIAMITPAAPVTPALRRIKITHGIIVAPVPLIFKNNEAVLSKDAEEGLKHVADYMMEHQQLKLIIQGYSDAYGPESYNKELSYYRSLWVKMALERYGVPANHLIMKPMGKTKQFGHNKATEAQNRRVVLRIAK